MIKLSEGELLDILPIEFKRHPEIVALSYALKRQYARLLEKMQAVYVYASIDTCSEAVLDHLAVEMRIRYYDTNFGIDRKRTLVKSAIFVSLKDGTKYAVDQVIQTALGSSDDKSQDWYEYGGEPGHFKVDLSMDTYDIDRLIDFITMVKRASAHLDGIGLVTRADQDLFDGIIIQTQESVSIGMESFPELEGLLTDENGNYLTDELGNQLAA